jgi:hypothetical protein
MACNMLDATVPKVTNPEIITVASYLQTVVKAKNGRNIKKFSAFF